MKHQFEVLKQSRNFILNTISNCNNKQLNHIPTGFKNNIIWNLGHLAVTQQLLCYKLSGLPCLISEELIEKFQKGSKPTHPITETEVLEIKKLLLELPQELEIDYNNNVFKQYTMYTTSVNITLNNIEEALTFTLFHEGIHLGVILQLLKLV